LIASTHRVYATSEKLAPGDGRADRDRVLDLSRQAAKSMVAFDMHDLAKRSNSHVSASLFGALAGSSALPFPVDSYVSVIEASGRGVAASLDTFHKACEAARRGDKDEPQEEPAKTVKVTGPEAQRAAWQKLVTRVQSLPEPVSEMALPGLRKVTDFQDLRLGGEYLERVETAVSADEAAGGGAARDWAYAVHLAKYLANAMCYDDLIRVADLKTRASRFDRVREHAAPGDGAILRTTEFMHPRAEELVDMLPGFVGQRIEAAPRLFRFIDRIVNKGRRSRSDGLPAFVVLYCLGGRKPIRRMTLRDKKEIAHREAWLDRAARVLPANYDLAVEILACRRLIKGYSDTHARGQTKFELVMEGADRLAGRDDAADWVRRLRTAALSDPNDGPLRDTLRTVDSFLG
jgi:indolepyruvate ferredoxin oxidoreductase beta subunit